MVHLFSFKSDKFAYDTETQAFLELDNLSHDVLTIYVDQNGSRPTQEALAHLSQKNDYPLEELCHCCDEIDALIADKSLFAPPVHVDLEQLYPDEVVIKSMCLHICHDCNLRCQYCFAGTGDFGTGRRTMLDVETGKKAIDFLLQHSGNRHHLDIDFFGGEPLMNWPVVQALVDYCEAQGPKYNKDLRLTLTTNCMLLDDQKIDYINEHFKNVVLSLDGRKEVQDDLRPTKGMKGSYDVVMRNIKNFVAKRGEKEYYVRGTFTRKHPDFSKDVIHMAEEQLGQLSMEPVVGPEDTDYAFKPEDLPQLKAEYERLAEHALASDYTDHAYAFFHFNIDLEGGPCMFKRLKGCGVGSEYCAVTPEGDIYPCHQFVGESEFIMGNVHDDPIQLKNPFEASFKSLILPEKPACQSCWAKYYCSGGCAANAWHETGDLNGIYEMGCELMRKRLECGLWLSAKRRERAQKSD